MQFDSHELTEFCVSSANDCKMPGFRLRLFEVKSLQNECKWATLADEERQSEDMSDRMKKDREVACAH